MDLCLRFQSHSGSPRQRIMDSPGCNSMRWTDERTDGKEGNVFSVVSVCHSSHWGAPNVVNHVGTLPVPHRHMRPPQPFLHHRTCSDLSPSGPSLFPRTFLRLKDLLVQHKNTCFWNVVGTKSVHEFTRIGSLDLKLSKRRQIDHTDSVVHHVHLPQYRVVPVGSPEGWFVSGIVSG